MAEPFLSIIIPIYKIKEEYLRICFDSLLAQDMTDFRIIAVDDGSPDNSGAICDEYANKDSRFTVIHQENAGVSVARNNGMNEADTEWITFVDPDDWVEPNHVSTLFEAQKQQPSTDIFLFDYIQEFADRSITRHLMEKSGEFSEDWVHNLRIAVFNYLKVDGHQYDYETNTIWSKMYRTSLIKNANLKFDSKARKGQDVIFNAECLQLTESIYYIKAALYHYRYLQGSITNRFNPDVQFYNEVAFENYERIIGQYHLPQEYLDAYYARVVTRLYSCMRLYYFHPENTSPKSVVNNEINDTLNRYPYNEALKKVKKENLSESQKVFVYFLRRRNYTMLRFLVNGRQKLRTVKLGKLRK